MDQETFYLNLTAVIEDSAPATWESEYSLLEYFNLTELSPLEISSLLLDVREGFNIFPGEKTPKNHQKGPKIKKLYRIQSFSSDEV